MKHSQEHMLSALLFTIALLLACTEGSLAEVSHLRYSLNLIDTVDIAHKDLESVTDSLLKKSIDSSTPKITNNVASKTVKTVSDELLKSKKKFTPNSKKALLFAIIPGGGQIYNRQYWKLPIVVGAYTACYYAISWNQDNLTDYANAFRELRSENPMEYNTWKDFVPYGTDLEVFLENTSARSQLADRLKRGRDFYRRNRDLSIIVSVAVYALMMIDAYVDAELFNFDISRDISLAVRPDIQPVQIRPELSNAYGLKFALNF